MSSEVELYPNILINPFNDEGIIINKFSPHISKDDIEIDCIFDSSDISII